MLQASICNVMVIGSGFGFVSYSHFLAVHIWERSLWVNKDLHISLDYIMPLHLVLFPFSGPFKAKCSASSSLDARRSWQTLCMRYFSLSLLVKCFHELHLPDRKSCTDVKCHFSYSLFHTSTWLSAVACHPLCNR